MNSRNEILKRLGKIKYRHESSQSAEWQDNTLYSNYPHHAEDLFPVFKKQLEDLSGEVYFVNDLDHFKSLFLENIKDVNASLCKAHKSPLIDKIKGIDPELSNYFDYIDDKDIDNIQYSKYDIGISCADALIARTGSILLRSLSAGGRRLSVLPPTHIVIAETKQLVPSLDQALIELQKTQDNYSYATIISGPSRTADIEKQLVLGAHGPKRLIVFVIKSS